MGNFSNRSNAPSGNEFSGREVKNRIAASLKKRKGKKERNMKTEGKRTIREAKLQK